MSSVDTYNHESKACVQIPPIQSDYTPKGSTKRLSGLETYETGKGHKHALICVYDVWGFSVQIKQGADALASTGLHVVIPDFFDGHTPSFEEFQKQGRPYLNEFFMNGYGKLADRMQDVLAIVNELKKEGAQRISLFGFCYGGKLSVVSAIKNPETFYKIGSIHPGQLNEEEYQLLNTPVAFFPSKDEDKSVCEECWKAVQANEQIASKSVYHYYGDMHHGWAASRGDLKNDENLKQFQDVYSRLAQFFNEQ